jgi:YHS domain-containing protein
MMPLGKRAAAHGEVSTMERDPVCGMELKPGQEEASLNYQGKGYHFCSVECRHDFEQDPKQYASGALEAGSERT